MPEWLLIFLLGAIAAAITMIVYRFISPQETLRRWKAEAKEVSRKLMKSQDDDFSVVATLAKKNIGLNLKRSAVTLPIVLVAAIPIILLYDHLAVTRQDAGLWVWLTPFLLGSTAAGLALFKVLKLT